MSQVFLALSAQTDLLEAWSYIADQSVDAADHVLDVIDKEAQTLALQPLMGRARPDLHPDIRYCECSRHCEAAGRSNLRFPRFDSPSRGG